MIIPGNPGDVALYQGFVADLRGRGHQVLISDHPLAPDGDTGLAGYAAHHARATRQYLAGAGRTSDDVEIVLVGHSVGAHLAWLMVSRDLLPVARVFLICPFLMRPALSGRLLIAFAGRRSLVRAALAAFRALPRRLRRWLVARAGAGEHAPWALAALESGQPALAAAVMAGHERREIVGRRDPLYLLEHPLFSDPARFVALFCADDRWAPPAVAQHLAPFARQLPARVTHAFVAHRGERELVAEVLHQLLVR